MTEDQIERQAELMMDRLDRDYLNSGMTQDEYEQGIRRIDNWVHGEYRAIGKEG